MDGDADGWMDGEGDGEDVWVWVRDGWMDG
jgi:hypothetical protein